MNQKMQVGLFCCVILLQLFQLSSGCNKIGQNLAAADIEKLTEDVKKSTQNLETALRNSAKILTSTIDNTVLQLNILALSATANFRDSIFNTIGDLDKISRRVTNVIDKGIKELSGTIQEVIKATIKIMESLSQSADRALEEFGVSIEIAVSNVRRILVRLNQSINNTAAEVTTTLSFLAIGSTKLSEQINTKIASNDLAGAQDVTTNALIASVEKLAKNWEILMNTTDVMEAPRDAAKELSKSLENLKLHYELIVGVDDNLKQVFLYISVAICVAVVVGFLCAALLIKDFRLCTVTICGMMFNCGKTNDLNDDSICNLSEVREETIQIIKKKHRKTKQNNLYKSTAAINTRGNDLETNSADKDDTETLLSSTMSSRNGCET